MSELKPIAYAIYGIGGGKLYLKDVKPIPADDITEEWRGDDDFLGDYWAGNKPLFLGRAQPEATKPAQDLSAAIGDTGNAEADRLINRLMSSDPDFDDCADAAAFIRRMVIENKGPDGFTTWKDAAVAERMKRTSGENCCSHGIHYDNACGACIPPRGTTVYASPADALVAGDRVDAERTGTLYQAVQRAAGELPEGWTICLEIERDAGTVELIDPEGNRKLIDGNDGYLCQAVNEATNAAIQAQKDGHGKS